MTPLAHAAGTRLISAFWAGTQGSGHSRKLQAFRAVEMGRTVPSPLMLQEGLTGICLKHPGDAGEPACAPVWQPGCDTAGTDVLSIILHQKGCLEYPTSIPAVPIILMSCHPKQIPQTPHWGLGKGSKMPSPCSPTTSGRGHPRPPCRTPCWLLIPT